MAVAAAAALKDRNLLAILGDEDTVTGILLAGVGHIDGKQNSNFLVVDAKTPIQSIRDTFQGFCKRKDVAIVLINQHVAEEIRDLVEEQQLEPFPVILEIPSKDHPYDPEKDSVLKRIQKMFGKE